MKKDIELLKRKIPSIEQEIRSFLDAISQDNPELDFDDEFKQDLLEGSTSFVDTIDSILINIMINESYIDSIKNTRARLQYRSAAFQKRIETLRELLKRLLYTAKMRKVSVPTGTVSLTAVAPSVEIIDTDLLPDEMMRIKKEPNKTLIGEKLKAGESVPGAQLSNGGETITVR